MKKLFGDRRLFLAMFAIICLMVMFFTAKTDISGAIVAIVIAIAGTNATENVLRHKKDSSFKPDDPDA